jgi:hypothetical protein
MVLDLTPGSRLDRLAAHHADEDIYFVQHLGPIGERTGIAPHDLYAPVDLSGSPIAAGNTSNARATTGQSAESDGESEWAMPPLPTLPGRP